MGRGRTARRSARGGEGIQALRALGARLKRAVAPLILLAGLAAYPAAEGGVVGEIAAVPGLLAAVLLVVAIATRWAALVPLVLVALVAEYAFVLVTRSEAVDAGAPLYAAGLLLLAEVAYWSLEPAAGAPDRGLFARRVATTAALALGGLAVATFVLVVAALPVAGGLALEALGIAAAAGALGVVAWLAAASTRQE